MKTLILIALLGLVVFTVASYFTKVDEQAKKTSEQRIERIDEAVGL